MRTVRDLDQVIDVEVIRGSKLKLGVDPLGGAGVHYWGRIGERYGFDLTNVNGVVDPTFAFMTLDWDGQIRMDPSSPFAMRRLIDLKGSLRPGVRLRHGPRPPRNRHEDGRGCCHPITT